MKRHYQKWSINEILKLQREYELLEMNIEEIAQIHERSEEAILWKLEQEGFINKTGEKKENLTNSKNNNKEKILEKILENELKTRMLNLENSMTDMKLMVKEVVENFLEQKRTNTNTKSNTKSNYNGKRKPLRISPNSYSYL